MVVVPAVACLHGFALKVSANNGGNYAENSESHSALIRCDRELKSALGRERTVRRRLRRRRRPPRMATAGIGVGIGGGVRIGWGRERGQRVRPNDDMDVVESGGMFSGEI